MSTPKIHIWMCSNMTSTRQIHHTEQLLKSIIAQSELPNTLCISYYSPVVIPNWWTDRVLGVRVVAVNCDRPLTQFEHYDRIAKNFRCEPDDLIIFVNCIDLLDRCYIKKIKSSMTGNNHDLCKTKAVNFLTYKSRQADQLDEFICHVFKHEVLMRLFYKIDSFGLGDEYNLPNLITSTTSIDVTFCFLIKHLLELKKLNQLDVDAMYYVRTDYNPM